MRLRFASYIERSAVASRSGTFVVCETDVAPTLHRTVKAQTEIWNGTSMACWTRLAAAIRPSSSSSRSMPNVRMPNSSPPSRATLARGTEPAVANGRDDELAGRRARGTCPGQDTDGHEQHQHARTCCRDHVGGLVNVNVKLPPLAPVQLPFSVSVSPRPGPLMRTDSTPESPS